MRCFDEGSNVSGVVPDRDDASGPVVDAAREGFCRTARRALPDAVSEPLLATGRVVFDAEREAGLSAVMAGMSSARERTRREEERWNTRNEGGGDRGTRSEGE